MTYYACFRSFLRARVRHFTSNAPVEWLMALNRIPCMYFHLVLMGSFVPFHLDTRAKDVTEGSASIIVLGGLFAVIWNCLGFTIMYSERPSAKTKMSFFIFSISITAMQSYIGPMILNESKVRMRLSGVLMVTWKSFTAMLGFPTQIAIVFILFSAVLDVGVQYYCQREFGDEYTSGMYFAVITHALGWLAVASMYQLRLRKLYDTQRVLTAEKVAFETLLSMVCDAALWLSEDGNTILKCDESFDMLVGKSMQGEKLETTLPEDECTRLRSAFSRADQPTSLPTSMMPCNSGRINVDLFMVRRCAELSIDVDGKPTFLVGVRIAGQAAAAPAEHETMDKLQLLDALDGVVAYKVEQQPSHVGTFETTSTGLIFKDAFVVQDNQGPTPSSFAALQKLGNREGWLLQSSDMDFQNKQILGEGSYGVVVGADLHGTGVAIKAPKVQEGPCDIKLVAALANELRILRHVRHPNIVLFFGAYLNASGTAINLVLERILGPSLRAYLGELVTFSDTRLRLKLALDIARGLRWLHAQKPIVIHGDLKDNNVLVERDFPRAKLVDFGLARILTQGAKPMGGTLSWAAPEVILCRDAKPEASADVFSFGRILYRVFADRQPLKSFQQEAIKAMAEAGQTMPLVWPGKMPLRHECFEVCESTSRFHANKRPTMVELHARVSAWDLSGYDNKPAIVLMNSEQHASDASTKHGTSEESASVSADLGIVSRCVLHNSAPTQTWVKEKMVIAAARCWNFPLPKDVCCEWHACLTDVQEVVRNMQARDCRSFLPHTQWQCASCGFLLQVQRPTCISCGAICHNRPRSRTEGSSGTLQTISEEALTMNSLISL